MADRQPPRLLPLGDAAWTVTFGDRIDPELQERVSGLHDLVDQARRGDPALAGILDLVPTFCALTVHFDPWRGDAAALGQRLLELAAQAQPRTVAGRCWHLPVCFDEAFAPDLPRVSEATGRSGESVIELLLTARLRVYMLGFQPGFAYMAGLPEALAVPRLPSPRQMVPARSLAIAGGMCAVYPWESPGGWNLLGRTPARLFDPGNVAHPTLLAAGDEVRWRPVDVATYERLCAEVDRGMPREHFLEAPDA